MVDGEAQLRAITLLDLGLALLFAAGTLVLLKRLPALLEILLLRRYGMSAADRYAVTALWSYVVGAVGIMLVLGTLGKLEPTAVDDRCAQRRHRLRPAGNRRRFHQWPDHPFERPIRVGDTVTLGDTDGVDTRIRIRGDFDRKELLAPNKELITSRLLNWTLSDPVTRIQLVVGDVYGSDLEAAISIMERLAGEHEHVVDDPPQFAAFDTFGDNAPTLTLRAYVSSIDVPLGTVTELNRAINAACEAAGLSIAFPQWDVHLDPSKPLRIRIEGRSVAG
ncbi:mechanosensitive ion channel domain-containing protein [Thiorhodococcus minor]|uniref:mechanosensitive ion channel domain-containing protein n=1 Tax=Thiorhodococcus minor TaxID=57489 RepID=UPI0031588AA5